MNTTLETSVSNISVLDLSKDDIVKEYTVLKNQFIAVQKELETNRQKVYELQRDLTRANALEKDYQQEIELLQEADKTECERLKTKLQGLEEEIVSMRVNHKEQSDCFELEVKEKDAEIEQMVSEKKEMAKSVSAKDDKENEQLFQENCALKEQLDKNVDELAGLTLKLNEYQDAHYVMESEIKELKSSLEEMTLNYKCKVDNLIEANNRVETLQEELCLARHELDSVRSVPMDTVSRGNSLFAEVDDRRLEVQSNMRKMKDGYLEMKREYTNTLKKFSALKMENAILSREWERDVKERQSDDMCLANTYKNRIETLEELVNKYQKIIAQQEDSKPGLSNEMQFFDSMLKSKDKEIKKLMEDVNKQSISQTLACRDLLDSRREKREWKVKAERLECELSQLKTEVEISNSSDSELQRKCIPAKTNVLLLWDPSPKVVPKVENEGVEFDLKSWVTNKAAASKVENEERKLKGKENESSNIEEYVESDTKGVKVEVEENVETTKVRRVKFTAETVDTKETNRKTYRKPGKPLVCPVQYISTKRKD